MLLMPPFLITYLSKEVYTCWLLVLQLSAYVALLDFGIQTAIGRYVAHHTELGELEKREQVVNTALFLLCILAVAGLFAVSLLAYFLPIFFTQMPNELQQNTRFSLLIVGSSIALSLPFSIFGGIFIGFKRYDVPAYIFMGTKLCSSLFVVVVSSISHNLILMALVVGTSNLVNGMLHYWACKNFFPYKPNVAKISKTCIKELFSYCSNLSLLNVSMILISGLDLLLIGVFDYSSTAYYSIAASLTGILPGLYSAAIAVILPNAAELGAKGNDKALGLLLISSTKFSGIILCLISLPLLLGSDILIEAWVGKSFVARTVPLLELLVIGNLVRYIGAPYATIAIAIGEQRKIVASPLVEGVVNLIIGLSITPHFGAIGVACGTLIGSFVSVVIHFVYNLPRTPLIKVEHNNLLVESILKPIIVIFPSALIWIFIKTNHVSLLGQLILIVLTFISSSYLMWNLVLSNLEKDRIILTVYEKQI